MGNVAYLFNDYVKDLSAVSISLTNENSDYPTENSQDEQVALCTRSTDKASIKYQITLSSSIALQAFSINNHNFSGGTFDINSYTAADFTTGKTTIETKTVRLLDVYHYESSAPAARTYWEFDLTNTTSADAYYEFGRIMAYGNLVQLTEVEDYEKPRGYGFVNIVNITPWGIRWVHKMAERQEEFELIWTERMATNIPGELRTLFESIHGSAHPFVFIPDISSTNCYYVYSKDDILNWSEKFGIGSDAHACNFTLRLIEAVRGKA